MSEYDINIIYHNNAKNRKMIIMLGKKKLKELSHVCAYCGKTLENENKTLDHILPQCAGGKSNTNNLVICCAICNTEKANQDITTFLKQSEQRMNNFYNYLTLIDNQQEDKSYSEQILKEISESSYFHKRKTRKKKNKKHNKVKKSILNNIQKEQINLRLLKPKNIQYSINGTNFNFKVDENQNKILEFYINSPEFTDYETLTYYFDLDIADVLNSILQMNNFTRIFVLKHISPNGMKMNTLFYRYLDVEQINEVVNY